MKKIILVLLFIPFMLAAQVNTGSIKIGYFNPGATEGGLMLGYQGSYRFDEVLEVGWGVDWFHKNYTDRNLAREFNDFNNFDSELNELRAKTNLHSVPIMGNVTAFIPAGRRLKAFVNGGLGAEMLLVFYNNYQNPDEDEFEGAFDFSWRLSLGAVYEIGRRSDLVAELGYHNSEPSWTYTIEENGRKRMFERSYDMSGVFLRCGVRFLF